MAVSSSVQLRVAEPSPGGAGAQAERISPVYLHLDVGQARTRQFVELVGALARSQITALYRRSLLGLAWAVLQPLAYLIVFLFIRGVFGAETDGVSFALRACCGLVLWTFFSNAVLKSAPSVLQNRGIVKKLAMPRQVFPASSVLVAWVDLLVASALLGVMMGGFALAGRFAGELGWALLWIPLLLLLTTAFALGMGLLCSAIGTYKHDLLLALPFGMQLWLLATPLLYSLDEVPERWRLLCTLNPMAGLVEAFRGAILDNAAPDPAALGLSILGIALLWAVAWPLFSKASQSFADVL